MEQESNQTELNIPTVEIEPRVLIDALNEVIPMKQQVAFSTRSGRMFNQAEEQVLAATVSQRLYNLTHAVRTGCMLISQSCLQAKKSVATEPELQFNKELESRLTLTSDNPHTAELAQAIHYSFEFLATESDPSILNRIRTPYEAYRLFYYCKQRQQKYVQPIAIKDAETEAYLEQI